MNQITRSKTASTITMFILTLGFFCVIVFQPHLYTDIVFAIVPDDKPRQVMTLLWVFMVIGIIAQIAGNQRGTGLLVALLILWTFMILVPYEKGFIWAADRIGDYKEAQKAQQTQK